MFAHLPQLNSIRVFDAAARLASFKAAALELNVTPTAVSHQIRALEEKLGTLLFERKTRSIVLTPEGEKLAQIAYRSLQLIADAFHEISDTQTILTVSTTTSFAAMWLIPRLDSFYRRHTEIQVVVKTGEQPDDLQKDRRIDLAIRYGEYDTKNKHACKLVTERFGMYATNSYLQACPHIDDATLFETTWQSLDLEPITWQKYLQSKNINHPAAKIRSYDQEHHVIQAALAGQGVALISSLLIQTAVEQGWLVKHPESESLTGLTYYMLTSAHNARIHKVEIFREWLLGEFAANTECVHP